MVGYIVPIHGPLDGPLYMGSIYTNSARYSKLTNPGVPFSHNKLAYRVKCFTSTSMSVRVHH